MLNYIESKVSYLVLMVCDVSVVVAGRVVVGQA